MRNPFAAITDRYAPTFWLLWGGMLLSRSGAFVMPFLMLFLTEQRGLSLPMAGFALSLFGAGAVAAAITGGQLADRWGRRPTVLLSMFGGPVAVLVLGAAPVAPVIFAASVAYGFFGELHRPAISASIGDVVEPKDQASAFAHLYWAYNLGFAIAPLVAGVLVARFNFTAVFIGNACVQTVCGLLAWRWLPETKPVAHARDAETPPLQALRFGVLRDARLVRFLLAFAPIPVLMLQVLSVLPVVLQQGGIHAATYGRILALNGLLIIALQPWVITRVASFQQSSVLAVGAILIGAGFAGHAFAASTVQHALALSIWTLGEIAVVPLAAGMVANLAPAEQRGRYQGAYGITWSLAHLAAPFIATRVLSSLGTSGWGIACACAGVFAALSFVLFGVRWTRG